MMCFIHVSFWFVTSGLSILWTWQVAWNPLGVCQYLVWTFCLYYIVQNMCNTYGLFLCQITLCFKHMYYQTHVICAAHLSMYEFMVSDSSEYLNNMRAKIESSAHILSQLYPYKGTNSSLQSKNSMNNMARSNINTWMELFYRQEAVAPTITVEMWHNITPKG